MTSVQPTLVGGRPPGAVALTQPDSDRLTPTSPPLATERRPGGAGATRPGGGTLGSVLADLAAGRTFDETARRLAIPVDAVRVMADHAARTGRLTVINQPCGGTCRSASSAICRTCPLAR